MFFVVVKMVRPDTHSGCSYIKSKLENMKMSQFKHDIPKENLQIAERMNYIYIREETYSEIMSHQLNLYPKSSCPLFKYYMDTRRSEWEEDNKFTAERVRSMTLKKYNNLLTS